MRVVGVGIGVLVAVAAMLLTGEQPAAAQECQPAGGATDRLPEHEAPDADGGDWALLGRGWGHGVGMSQYGAYGAATLGCSSEQILETYYEGAQVGESGRDGQVQVSLQHAEEGTGVWERATVEALAGELRWQLPDGATRTQSNGQTWRLERGGASSSEAGGEGEAQDLPLPDDRIDDLLPSGEEEDGPVGDDLLDGSDPVDAVEEALGGVADPDEVVDDAADELTAAVEEGRAEAQEEHDDALVVLRDGDGDVVWSGGEVGQTVEIPLDGQPTARIEEKGGNTYGEGRLRFEIADGDGAFAPSMRLDSLDQYTNGVREVPHSWPSAALQAQAITARGYAERRLGVSGRGGCPDCQLVDTPADQVYAGLSGRGPRWVDAVRDTSGQVVRYDGETVDTFYSSSHGGQSERPSFSAVFGEGAEEDYYKPVDDSRWELAASDANPHLAWTREVTDADVAAAAQALANIDVGEVQDVRTPEPRGAGGRVGVPDRGYGGVEIVGSDATVQVSGWAFQRELGLETASGAPGLRSELFEVVAAVDADAVLPRLAGPGRLDTAAEVAREGWDAADEAVVARADDFADALAATALAARRDAPLLLTSRRELSSQTAAALADLGVDRVAVMGGSQAVGGAVVSELRDAGYAVRRVAGETRFATAADAAASAHPDGSGEVALALGTDWPDALAAGALAASSDRVPTLLTLSGEVPNVTLAALEDLDAQQVRLIGGTAVISDAVAGQLQRAGYEVSRLSGGDRFATSAAVAGNALDRDARDRVVLASGADFPDALAAGAFSARAEGIVQLVPARGALPSPVADLLRGGAFSGGWVLGGSQAVSDDVHRGAAQLVAGS